MGLESGSGGRSKRCSNRPGSADGGICCATCWAEAGAVRLRRRARAEAVKARSEAARRFRRSGDDDPTTERPPTQSRNVTRNGLAAFPPHTYNSDIPSRTFRRKTPRAILQCNMVRHWRYPRIQPRALMAYAHSVNTIHPTDRPRAHEQNTRNPPHPLAPTPRCDIMSPNHEQAGAAAAWRPKSLVVTLKKR